MQLHNFVRHNFVRQEVMGADSFDWVAANGTLGCTFAPYLIIQIPTSSTLPKPLEPAIGRVMATERVCRKSRFCVGCDHMFNKLIRWCVIIGSGLVSKATTW